MTTGWAAFWMLATFLFGCVFAFVVCAWSLGFACVFWDGCPECKWTARHRTMEHAGAHAETHATATPAPQATP